MACGSISGCPVCAPKVRHGRAVEIDRALRAHLARGGGIVFATFTVPHDRGMSLADLWQTIAESWKTLIAGRARQTLRDRWGLVGFVRSFEATHGRNGWHPHAHVVLLTDRDLEHDEFVELWRWLAERWAARVVAMGHPEPSMARGVLCQPVTAEGLAGYVSKVIDDHGAEYSPGAEIARGDAKRGRAWGSRAPFQILADYTATGRASDLALYREWLAASFGRRIIEWSRGLRAELVGDEPERTDEELASKAEPGSVPIAMLDREVWRAVTRCGCAVPVLVAAEVEGLAGVLAVLDRQGIRARARDLGAVVPVITLASGSGPLLGVELAA
jgi:Replication protein